MRALDQITSWFTPEELIASRHGETAARNLVRVILTDIGLTLLAMGGVTLYLESLSPANYALSMGVLTAVLLGFVAALVLFKVKGSFVATGNVVAATCYAATVCGTYCSGGPRVSPVVFTFIIVPVFAFLIGGLRSGVSWAVAVTVTEIAMLVAAGAGWEGAQLLRAEDLVRFQVVLPTFVGLIVFAVLAVYETSNARLKALLNADIRAFAYRASHDPLTGLANRAELALRLEQGLARCGRGPTTLAVIYIDLDGFKPINDRLGHEAGDEVLVGVASRLRAAVRSSDTVARLGGDEFAVLLEGAFDRAALDRLARTLIEAVAEPIDFGGRPLRVHASAGVAIYPEDGVDPAQLFRAADAAMYRAKSTRRAVHGVA